MTGIERIAAERRRQIEQEGWSPERDDAYQLGELVAAARAYATLPERRRFHRLDGSQAPIPIGWPWAPEWWKPTPDDRCRELEKAGALALAEMARCRRAGQPVHWEEQFIYDRAVVGIDHLQRDGKGKA